MIKLILLTSILKIISSIQIHRTANKITHIDYDGIVFNAFWMPYMVINKGKQHYFRCQNMMTIHDLWPSNFTGMNYDCNKTIPHNPLPDLSNLPQTLNTYWPSYTSSNYHFWKEEYLKHGLCYLVDTYASINRFFILGTP